MSLDAYRKTQNQSETPQQIEYRLFANVTHALIELRDMENPTPRQKIDALDWNRRMWSTLSSDCGTAGNQLPKELRAQIISLGLWVSRFTTEVARGTATVDALIDVNTAIMEGLAAQAKLQRTAATPEQPEPANAPEPGAVPPRSTVA
ncbi:MAG: flagellar biosynthesis regulator FlaF [Pseudomonadota bacterium]